jgi:hypothetical protein
VGFPEGSNQLPAGSNTVWKLGQSGKQSNPWEKFEIANPKESKEYLASNHYSQSFDECMDDVDNGCVRE